jgi:glycosyltransferase involved in cell wall biosynthesis
MSTMPAGCTASLICSVPVSTLSMVVASTHCVSPRDDRQSAGLAAGAESQLITVVQAFDAYAGAQRVAAQLVTGLRRREIGVRFWLGYGRRGFASDARPDWRFLPVETPRRRKLLYPLWLVAANLAALLPLLRGHILWANSIAAVPVAGPFLLFAPLRLVIHLHENNLPGIARAVVAWAGRRGATVLAVSQYHQQHLGLECAVLANAVGSGAPPPLRPPSLAARHPIVFVGTVGAMKGLPLFVQLAQRLGNDAFEFRAFLAGSPVAPSAAELETLLAANITVTIGETRADRLYDGAWLVLQLTNSALSDETFSLVAAESLWNLVPVGGAGAGVLTEVVGSALAFNLPSRDADEMAAAIRALHADPARHAALVAACAVERQRFATDRFVEAAIAIAAAAHD